MHYWLIQTFNGISFGALLFLLASGLSLIFGVMRIANLAHGSYFLLGGYMAITVIRITGSWLLAIPLSALAVAVLGMGMERLFLRRMGSDVLRQVLLTIGFALLFQQAALDIWGGDNMDIRAPQSLDWSLTIGTLYLSVYRLFMIAMAVLVGIGLWLVLEATRVGAMVRAVVDDAEMARGIGIDTSRVSLAIFALGAFLAALKGGDRGLILLVEQNVALALKLVDYVHVISKGQIVYSSEPETLWANEEVKSRYLGI